MKNKKTILFFGDSLTFCRNPETRGRHIYQDRWTSMVEEKIKEEFRIIVEGQGGRTIDQDDDLEGKNGLKSFISALYSHNYLEYIFIMLGTNNLKARFRLDANLTAEKFVAYDLEIKKFCKDWETTSPIIILIAPPKIREEFIPKDWTFAGAQGISNNLVSEYKKICEKLGWNLLDASEILTSELDGIHLDKKGNEELAEIVTNYISKNL